MTNETKSRISDVEQHLLRSAKGMRRASETAREMGLDALASEIMAGYNAAKSAVVELQTVRRCDLEDTTPGWLLQ